MDIKLRTGYRVYGANTSNGDFNCWYFPTLDAENIFAQQLCETTNKEVDVTKYIGSWHRVTPVEFIAAEEEEKCI